MQAHHADDFDAADVRWTFYRGNKAWKKALAAHPGLTLAAKLVGFACNIDATPERNFCDLSQETIANHTGLSKRTVRDSFAQLEATGFLQRQRRRYQASVYRFTRFLPAEDVLADTRTAEPPTVDNSPVGVSFDVPRCHSAVPERRRGAALSGAPAPRRDLDLRSKTLGGPIIERVPVDNLREPPPMSDAVHDTVRAKKFASSIDKAILLEFAWRAADDGTNAFAARVADLAETVQCSIRTTQRHLAELRNKGLILITGGNPCPGGSVPTYAIDLEAIRALPDLRLTTQGEENP